MIQLVLLVPDRKWAAPLKRAAAFHFEAVWQRIKAPFHESGLLVALDPCDLILDVEAGAGAPSILALVRRAATENARRLAIEREAHLGDALRVTVEDLLPLPESTCARTVRIPATEGLDAWLRFQPVGGGPPIEIESPGAGRTRILVESAVLESGRVYDWSLEQEDLFGAREVKLRGRISTLTARQREEWMRADQQTFRERMALLRRLRLNGDYLAEVSSLLVAGRPVPMEDRLYAYRLALAAHDWMRSHMPGSRRAGDYNHLADWLALRLDLPVDGPAGRREK